MPEFAYYHPVSKPKVRNLFGGQLFVLFVAAALIDTMTTLYFQSSEYWSGNYGAAADANPLVEAALRVSPWLAIPGYLGWITVIGIFSFLYLPPRYQFRVFSVLTIAHLVFTAGWVVRFFFS